MKKAFPLLLLVFFTMSCKNTWDEDDKYQFQQACTQDAITWARSPEKAKTYCDCVLDKMMKKYPNENDALEHLDSIAFDSSVQRCRNEAK